jgi:Transferrin
MDSSSEWKQALLMLLESYYVNITSLNSPIPIDDYLDKSSGYQSAHSFPACYPPRQIVYCTYSLIDFVKCSWLQEISTVYKIEPNIQCIRGESRFRCLDDVNKNIADVVLVDQDARIKSETEFNLTSLLFEFSSEFENNYVTVAVVKASSNIKNFEDLRGKTACFPSLDGASFYAIMENLQESKLIERNNCTNSVVNFFSPRSCYGKDNCREKYGNDKGALECLKEFGDVAFMNLATFQNLTAGTKLKKSKT